MKENHDTPEKPNPYGSHNREWFEQAKDYALDYMESVRDRRVCPTDEAVAALSAFDEPLPDKPGDPGDILKTLHETGSPATVAQTGGRYFGFVNGGVIPGVLAARWLSDAWDQNAALYVMSPVTSVLEDVCERWLIDLLGLPAGTAAGLVGGPSAASLCGLAAGRNALTDRMGYDVARRGLYGAPELRVVLGEDAHSTVYKTLSILGLGSERLVRVPTDSQGRMRPSALPQLDDRTILILQAGNVNSGAFDDFTVLCSAAREAGAWVHVDGAFGLWAAASQDLRHLTAGMELADSWSVDAHKTLNAPYDNGITLCRHPEALTRALHMTGAYIQYSEHRDGMLHTPDMSRRARAVELWATLKAMGREGVAQLVDGLHQKAAYFAQSLSEQGFCIPNDVCFNQVLVSAGDPALTEKTLQGIQSSGVCWCGGSRWKGEPVIRISVCSHQTTYGDVDRSVEAFAKARDRAVAE